MWRLREDVEAKVHRLPLSYFDRVQRGELISRVTNDIDNITQTMQQSLSSALTSVLTVVGVLIMMFSISWQLAARGARVAAAHGRDLRRHRPEVAERVRHPVEKVGRLNARVEESFSGHALVKVFGREQDSSEKFRAENEELYEAAFKAQFLSGIIMPGMMFIGNLTYVGIAVLGGLMVASGQLRLGDVQAFIQYSQQFTQPLSQLGGMAAVVQSGTASAERVFELLDADEQEPDAADAPAPVDGDGTIEFEHVSFSYTPERPLIRDLSFRVEPGQTVAIVGSDGRRQDDAREPHHAVLRARRRAHPARRAGHRRPHPARRARTHGHGAAGPVAVRRLDPREHPVRPRDGDRRRDPRGRPGDVRRPVRALASRWVRHRARRGRVERLGGREAAHHDRPCVRGAAVGADPRRGHLLGRHPHRAAAAARDGGAAARAARRS